jgi:uncharacterized protein
MNKIETAKLAEEIVKNKLKDAEKGHDWYHIDRVRNMALEISETEGGDKEIIEISALLHDISDAKFNGGNYEKAASESREILKNINFNKNKIENVIDIIDNISFKGGISINKVKSLELKIVQDADRLDAIGAIGIARAFHYGGFKNRVIYNPEIKPQNYSNSEEYHKSESHTINHFYEKLLLLKDLMNTKKAQEIAENRHLFMKKFLEQFYNEWKSKK